MGEAPVDTPQFPVEGVNVLGAGLPYRGQSDVGYHVVRLDGQVAHQACDRTRTARIWVYERPKSLPLVNPQTPTIRVLVEEQSDEVTR